MNQTQTAPPQTKNMGTRTKLLVFGTALALIVLTPFVTPALTRSGHSTAVNFLMLASFVFCMIAFWLPRFKADRKKIIPILAQAVVICGMGLAALFAVLRFGPGCLAIGTVIATSYALWGAIVTVMLLALYKIVFHTD